MTQPLAYSTPTKCSQCAKKDAIISWFHHYITDKQYERIPSDKDFELRDILKQAKVSGKK